MRKGLKRLIAGTAALCVASGFGWGFWRINHLYPAARNLQYAPGETAQVNGFRFTVESWDLIAMDEMASLFADVRHFYTDPDGNPAADEDIRFLLVNMQVTVPEQYESLDTLYGIAACSGPWKNGLAIEIFSHINANQLVAGEQTLVLPYAVHRQQFLEEDWKFIDNRHFELVVSLYPNYTVLNLT